MSYSKTLAWIAFSVGLLWGIWRIVFFYWMPSEAELIQRIQEHFPYPMTIQSAQVTLRGWTPIIILSDVSIAAVDHHAALTLKKASIIVDPYALLHKKGVLEDVIIEGLTVKATYSASSFVFPMMKRGSQASPFLIKHIHIPSSDWTIVLDEGKTVTLASVALAVSFSEEEEAGWQMIVQWTPPAASTPQRWQIQPDPTSPSAGVSVQATGIDMASIGSMMKPFCLAAGYPSPETGKVESLSFRIVDQRLSSLRAIFSGIEWRGTENHSTIASASGVLRYFEGKASLALAVQHISIQQPQWFEKAIEADHLAVHLQWETPSLFDFSSGASIQGHIAEGRIEQARITGDFSFHWDEAGFHPVAWAFNVGECSVSQALAALPKKVMNKELVTWLERALQAGQIRRARIAFPLEAEVVLENVLLDYDTRWPVISELDAILRFRDEQMTIEARSGKIAGGQLLPTTVTLPTFRSPGMLAVEAGVHHEFISAREAIQHTPLKETIGKTLSAFQMKGEFDLHLGLMIPLNSEKDLPIHVTGDIAVQQATVALPAWEIEADHLHGKVHFTEHEVWIRDVQGKMWGENTQFAGALQGHEAEKVWEMTIKGCVNDRTIKEKLNISAWDFMAGSTEYSATLRIPWEKDNVVASSRSPYTLAIDMPLTQMVVDLSAPLGKTVGVTKPMSLIVTWEPDKKTHMHLHYGAVADAAFTWNVADKQWRVRGGHINIGDKAVAVAREDGIVLIDGKLEEWDLQAWKDRLILGRDSGLSFEPLITLTVNKFTLYNETFINTHIDARWDKIAKLWSFTLEGPSLKGHVAWPAVADGREILIDLKKLVLSADRAQQDSAWWEHPTTIERPIEVKIRKLKMGQKTVNHFQARVEPSWKGYDFPRIQAKIKGADILLSGQWDIVSHAKQVTAEGKIITRNTSELFKTLGIAGTVHQARGQIDFSLSWQGYPLKIDYPSLTGKASFQLANGYVQGVNPGIGRVLNLLSIDTVQRRLSLDFSDVTRQGLAFDDFRGKCQFGKGTVSSNKVSLRGPSANIESYGQINLENQEVRGEIIVMPNVTGSLPVAAAIAAGHPAVGAAVWMVDKMLGKKLQAIHRYHYRLVGTWDAPKLEEVPLFPMRRIS